MGVDDLKTSIDIKNEFNSLDSHAIIYLKVGYTQSRNIGSHARH